MDDGAGYIGTMFWRKKQAYWLRCYLSSEIRFDAGSVRQILKIAAPLNGVFWVGGKQKAQKQCKLIPMT